MKNNSNEICPIGDHLQHYWDRLSSEERKLEFDEEGLFSLTPGKVALEIADNTPGNLIVDAFCGVGGSAIGFALRGKSVIAIDNNSERLSMARNNSEIFGVCCRIEFIEGDSMQILPTLKPDSIFLDPPWGGTDYGKIDEFKLSNFEPGGKSLLDLSFSITNSVVMRLPKNFDLDQLNRFNRKYELRENFLDGLFLHYCVYFQ
jgi:trimethylguanosine synthase